MPIYEYQCKECGVRFERMQSFSEDPVKICPECEGNVQRLIQPAGIIFKGSGFYVNDSRGSRKNLMSKSRKESSGEGKSETKSEAKSKSSEKSSGDD
jgi:putative FmdB family regulatory protein